MFDLTPEQIAAFHRDGYLVLDAITTQDEVTRLRVIYDRIFAERAGRDVGDQFDLAGADEEGKAATLPQILNPSKYAPELAEAAYRANAEALARELLGPEVTFLGEHAIFKPARIGAATPWHQDEAYWEADQEYEAISVWMPLQVATVDNGCMWFVPGSHLLEVQPHHNIDHDPRITGLVVDEINPEGAVACPIPAGGATIHHCRTMHYTGPNRSDIPRRAYILIFGVPPRPRPVGEARDFYWRRNDEQQAREARRKASEGGG